MIKKIFSHLDDSLLKCNSDLEFILEEEDNQIQVYRRGEFFAIIVCELNPDGFCNGFIWTGTDSTEKAFELDDLIILGELAKLIKEILL